jgi:hypothetical protein
MKKLILLSGLVALGLGAVAAVAAPPVQYAVDIPVSDVAADTEWTVPLRQYGSLLTLQALGAGSAETLAVKHVSTYAAGKAVTNTVETAAARNTLLVYPTEYVPPITTYYVTNDVILTATSTPVKPVHVQPGDKFLLRLSATNASTTVIIKTTLLQ